VAGRGLLGKLVLIVLVREVIAMVEFIYWWSSFLEHRGIVLSVSAIGVIWLWSLYQWHKGKPKN
jgi:hypothetical protein